MSADKKIFAEYHNPRYTRELDGELGNWSYTNESKNSNAVVKRCNYNADLIDERGRNQLAAVNYPVVGMQSQNDPDYIEYQILLAKLAYIDGFMTDFRHVDDKAGVTQLELLCEVAKKYKFEIGVDWCDAQIFYSLKKVRPELDSREKQIDYCKEIFSYLLRRIYNDETGANIDGHPVILLFGDGFSFEEYQRLKKEAEGYTDKEPWYFRRTMMNCDYDGRNVKYSFDENHEYFTKEHRGEIAGPFGWVPFRVRDAVADGKPYWDVYATKEDCIAYLETLRKHTAENRDSYRSWISIATPGMDHRGCVAWGRAISGIERGEGEIYTAMWQYNVEHRDETDAVFLAGWNDYNEGHEIEPTVENGYRELILTAHYGTRFKGIELQTQPQDFRLPEQLFALRKRTAKLWAMGCTADEAAAHLDAAALSISERDTERAREQLQRAEREIEALWSRKRVNRITVSDFREVCRSECENIAGRAEASVSSELATCEGRRMLDGERQRSYWQSEPCEASAEIRWKEPHSIFCIKLFTGWTERADRAGWPMIPKHIAVEYESGGIWKELWSTENNETQDIEIPCGITTAALRISSHDEAGLVIRGAEALEKSDGGGDTGCYGGAGFQMPEEKAAQIRGRYFDGYLMFRYWDEGYETFEVRSAGKFRTVCRVTTDDTRTWKRARVRLYASNTDWSHSLKDGADLMFMGNVKIKETEAEFDVYKYVKEEE